jgi:hypothetical protein
MSSTDIEDLLANVSAAAEKVQSSLISLDEAPEILVRFWWLQDLLERLVEAVADHHDNAVPLLHKHFDRLKTQIEAITSTAPEYKAGKIPAVVRSCQIIYGSLTHIERLGQASFATAV